MSLDINTKKAKKNAWRIAKERGMGASRIRIPGGYTDARILGMVQEIAEEFGNGFVHLTTRQGFEIEGIHLEDMEEVNKRIQPIIDIVGINQYEQDKDKGYSASGTRNVSACIGNNVCPFANYNTSEFARKVDKAIFPNDLHVKVCFTGCPNDCAKVRMHDFGIMGMTMPQYDPSRCISCNACVKGCKALSVDALSVKNFKIERNAEKCVGCGVCVTKCPTRAWTRSTKKYYKLTIMGRTGKKNPRLGQDFLIWADEENIIKIIKATYQYAKEHIDPNAPGGKEHIGYIIDRTGFEVFKDYVLKDVELMPETVINNNVYWGGIHFDQTQIKK